MSDPYSSSITTEEVHVADCAGESLLNPLAPVPDQLLSSWDAYGFKIFAMRDDIFGFSNVNCPIDTCEILDLNDSPYTSPSFETIETKWQYLFADHEIAGGFTENIKIRCT